MSEPVELRSERAILQITLNRPDRRNAVDVPMATALAAALEQLDADPAVAVGVISGAGGGFSSGLDLVAYEETGELPMIAGRGFAGIAERSARKPLIAAVEGFAIAGGLEIALACDVIVAGAGSIFGLPETQRGLVAAGGGLFGLTRRTSLGAALELSLTGEPISVERAHEIGIVDHVVPAGGALSRGSAIAELMAFAAPLAVAATKQLLRLGWTLGEGEFRAMQEDAAAEVLGSDDAAEGVRAFNERRPPHWSGR